MADQDRADCYRRLAAAIDDWRLVMNLIPLLPYAVKVNGPAPVRLLDRIPAQRRPVPPGLPTRPRQWPLP